MIDKVTACLVTRGDQPEMMDKIGQSLIFPKVIIWDNSRDPDWKCAGRYMAAMQAKTPLVYFQDDDVIVPKETQLALVDAYEQGVMVANWGHGENADGYDDLPLVGGGAICDRMLPINAIWRYRDHFPLDTDFMYEADFIIGVLYREFRHLHLPFEIDLSIAQAPERLCNQPWQRELKLKMTERAREIRDRELVAA